MQLTSFKKIYRITSNCFGSPKMLRILQVLAVLSLTGLATQVFAVDLLSGTEASLVDTLKGTGKKYLYIAECVISLLVYIQSKNVMVLIGIVVVAIFFNIMLTMTGSV